MLSLHPAGSAEETKMIYDPMPTLVVHADWGSTPRNRYMTLAILKEGQYLAREPELVGDPKTLLERMRAIAGEQGAILIGFDFPIGLPVAYARRAGVHDFLAVLPELGRGNWADFYALAERPDDINLRRPFYPYRPGGTRRQHLVDALGVGSEEDLLRRCERAYGGRYAASSIFWTLGAKQVGRAAIIGWREVLTPALVSGAAIWPFHGELHNLVARGRTVIVETYPAEFYKHLGIVLGPGGKRSQETRRATAAALLRWAGDAGVELSPALRGEVEDGFGASADGEDRFDATVGLFGMLNVALGRRAPGEPEDQQTRKIEGWMLGQARGC
jgi:hypothetical protein